MAKNQCQNKLKLSNFDPQKELFDKIMDRIHKEQKIISLKRKFALFSIIFLGSGVLLFSTFQMLKVDFFESGFLDYFSLIFFNTFAVLKYWQSFLLSLLESLPFISLILFLFALFIFLYAIEFFLKNIKIALKLFKTAKKISC